MVLARVRPHTARIVGGLILLALIATGLILSRNARHDAAVAEGRRLLLEGDFARATARFEPVQTSSRVGAQARAGLIVARAAGDDSGGDASGALRSPEDKDAIAEAGVPLLPLLDGAMRHRRYGATLALARLATEGGDASGLPYQGAALIELGRDADARALLDAHPAAFRVPGLGAAVSEVLALRSGGPVIVVRDRAGRLVGAVDAAGRLQAATDLPKEWVPPLALRALRPGSTAGARLTIDLALTQTAAESLTGRRGSIVLVDPATGAVRVALSDAATFAGEGGTPAFEQQREPASIQKIITSTATLRSPVAGSIAR